MKKNVYFFVFVLLLSLSVTSCKKDSATTNTKTTGSASVSGTLKANLDMTNDTTQNGTPQIQNENVPAGTLITFIIDSKDLQDNPDSAYVYPKLEYTTTVEANGAFSISLPANTNPINAEVRFADFRYNVIVGFQGSTPITHNLIFSKAVDHVSIYNKAVVIKDYTY